MFSETAPLEFYMLEAKICCWKRAACARAAEPGRGPAKPVFTFFIGWGLLLKGCSEACRTESSYKPHLAVLTQSCSPATFIWGWRRKCDSSVLPWDHRGLPCISGRCGFPSDDLRMMPPCRKAPLLGMKFSAGRGKDCLVSDQVTGGQPETYFLPWGQDVSAFHLLKKGRWIRNKTKQGFQPR